MKKQNSKMKLFALITIILVGCSELFPQWQPTPNDTLKSITILPENKVVFEVYAPEAKDVKLGGSDIPANLIGKMIKSDIGVWETTVGPLEPGAYRYNFVVDKITVMDSRNPITSESNMNSWSMMYLPGKDFMDLKDVPHGALSEVTYFSKSLQRFRRMHIYTPAGYEANSEKYPVLYLLHGAFDCDDSWGTVGRAGIILDNLIAEKKAVPMVVVMPAGHTGPFSFSSISSATRPKTDEFVLDFNNDIKPYIEKNYRVLLERENTAIAGLSMGGAHTLSIAIPNLAEYAYFGVFSSGILGIVKMWNSPDTNEPTWEEQNKELLVKDDLKKDLKLVWFATGKDDFLIETSRASVNLLKKYNFNVTYKETTGGHTWNNWRDYLNEFAQLLFK